jgi:hypothetical protein
MDYIRPVGAVGDTGRQISQAGAVMEDAKLWLAIILIVAALFALGLSEEDL